MKLAKADLKNWSTLLGDQSTPSPAPNPTSIPSSSVHPPSTRSHRSQKDVVKNWDKVVDDELAEKEGEADPVSRHPRIPFPQIYVLMADTT
jgi:hypothetical protein